MTRRILIVDDEQGIRAALGQLLEFEGYDVKTAANAVDGLAEYARSLPSLRTNNAAVQELNFADQVAQLESAKNTKTPSGLAAYRSKVVSTLTSVFGRAPEEYSKFGGSQLRGRGPTFSNDLHNDFQPKDTFGTRVLRESPVGDGPAPPRTPERPPLPPSSRCATCM